jgi:hypothetical protein
MPHFRAAGAVCPARVCLAGELVPGFLDRFAQRAVTGPGTSGRPAELIAAGITAAVLVGRYWRRGPGDRSGM